MLGLLTELTGMTVEEFTFVGDLDESVCMEWDGMRLDMGIFNDILEINKEDVKVLARYTSNYYEGKSALVERTVGNGKIFHFGGTFTRDTVQSLLKYVDVLGSYKKQIELPAEYELCVREKDGEKYFFILNYSSKEQEIRLKKK